jgi:hypothetical protein
LYPGRINNFVIHEFDYTNLMYDLYDIPLEVTALEKRPGGSENPITSTKRVLPYTYTEKSAEAGCDDINKNNPKREEVKTK